jgi:hypothetical protein
LGLRFFVDALLEVGSISPEEVAATSPAMTGRIRTMETLD